MGRHVFYILPPSGVSHYAKELVSPDAKTALFNLAILYVFVAFFWSLYDQTGSAWVMQAERMNRIVSFGGTQFEILASQVQAVNPVLVMALIPLYSFVIYPLVGRYVEVTPLRKIGAGFVLTIISFGLTAFAETLLESGAEVSILWQVASFVIITAAEVLVSITALEFSYTQAPNSLKSLVMGIYLLSVTLGNQITSLVNTLIQDDSGKSMISGSNYYLFFTGLMAISTVVYLFYSRTYKGKTFVHA
jgi:POT family proton-dependent oligopeptide transporter